MRDYGKIIPAFWTGSTGRLFRGDPEAQVLACYLCTCPSANMVGLYYLPFPTLCHETGLTQEGASKALRRVQDASFAFYDPEAEVVWVPEMARIQIGASLAAKDNRVKGVLRELEPYKKHRFFGEFAARYWGDFSLPGPKPLRRAFEAPSEPLRSQEQEQDQDQEQDQEETFPAQKAALAGSTGSAEAPPAGSVVAQPPLKLQVQRAEPPPRKPSWQQEMLVQMQAALVGRPGVDVVDPGPPVAELNTRLKQASEKFGREWLLPAWDAWCESDHARGLDPPFAVHVFLQHNVLNRYVAQARRSAETTKSTEAT